MMAEVITGFANRRGVTTRMPTDGGGQEME
jgi:hypothetical protein